MLRDQMSRPASRVVLVIGLMRLESRRSAMNISAAYSYLVTPDKNAKIPHLVNGVSVPLSGKLFEMLSVVYVGSDLECDVPIRFLPTESGKQANPIRDLVVGFAKSPTEAAGGRLAEALRDVSTMRSGLGLLFLLVGRDSSGSHKIVISRFPADQGVVANPDGGRLKIDFVEQVFMKSANAYKAAMYRGKLTQNGFWDGHVVDKQINAGVQHVADYWVRAFLQSEIKTTSKAGTRRLADAVMVALRKSSDVEIKQELTSAITLAERQLSGKATSIREFCDKYSLTDGTVDLLRKSLPNEMVFNEKFRFDASEFRSRAKLRSVSLDNGAILTSELAKFDECFTRDRVRGDQDKTRFSTVGRVVDDRIRGAR